MKEDWWAITKVNQKVLGSTIEQIKWFNEINAKNIEIRWCGCNYTNTDNYGIYMYFIVSLSWIVSKK